MVTPQPQLQVQPQQPAPSSQDEALKRNTDCVYFLASPLTCKKGNECEYRHSEYARVNPRDCRYWLSGNCLNPKCSFRHPPLDGLLGTQAATAGGPSVSAPPSQIPTASAIHASYNSTKQAVPCFFFQKGLCLKGDRCAFMHGPPAPSTGNKVAAQVPVTSQGVENPGFKKPFGTNEKYTQERKTSQGNVAKSGGDPEPKPAPKIDSAPKRNMFELEKEMPPPSGGFDNEASRFKTSSPPVTNGPTVVRSSRLHQARVPDDHNFHSGKDNDEFLRESSPGFDVLVADELRNSDYYHGEDEFGKARGPDERNLDSLNEYDLGHSGEYGLAADIDRERFRVPQGYESYDHTQEPYLWEQHRKASAHLDRRTRRRSGSPENAEISDLRHHLSKRRKVNGLKSVVSHDHALEGHGEEQSHRSFSRKDSLQLPLNESSLGNRFRGRIKLPANGDTDQLERDDRGRIRGRLLSGRLQATQQGRIHDRMRGRLQDDERRNSKDRLMGRELIGGDRSDFAGPKSLAELKNGRNPENREPQPLGKRGTLRDDHPQSEDDLQFDGPKPLSEILKEKKRGGPGGRADGDSGNGKSSNIKNEEVTNGLDPTQVTNTQNGVLSEIKEFVNNQNNEESKVEVTEVVGGETGATDGQYEEGMYDEAGEDQYYEGDDQREGDYEYEQGDEGYYEYDQGEEGENQEEEYMDEEDGDDFAKKIGVIHS
ncbi:zinc finger CCCH domain-containing protein 17 [Vigna radiata var. radiata]|uniref:Zinc finger CCCH domain-containing protein 17 n=1 Tax=Vigna radiata var. radiata TaxID=3916 RepID=A0A1S3VZT5_VIGRR|nr:zinc finger CCCH domain-containing protein 17 [Vigna radiata var. radiata]